MMGQPLLYRSTHHHGRPLKITNDRNTRNIPSIKLKDEIASHQLIQLAVGYGVIFTPGDSSCKKGQAVEVIYSVLQV